MYFFLLDIYSMISTYAHHGEAEGRPDLGSGRVGPVSVSDRNRRFSGSSLCEPNLNRILNGSWAVSVLGGFGPVPV